MKGRLIVLTLFCLLAIGCIYIFVPDRLKISNAVYIKGNQQGIYRFLADKSNWARWWQGSTSNASDMNTPIFTYGDYDFQINRIQYNAFDISLKNNYVNYRSLLTIFSNSVDSIQLQWSTELIAGANPLKRIRLYFTAKKIHSHFKDILHDLKDFLSRVENIYGIDIKKEQVQFQFLISTKQSYSKYPTTQEIYAMIDRLRNHLAKGGGKAEYFPMLNIQTTDSLTYQVQVALPVDKEIPDGDNISLKRMLKGGNILVSEVAGGTKNIDNSMKRFAIYISDYQLSIVAIPFQLLITDRLKEPDSAKWITKLYYPVI